MQTFQAAGWLLSKVFAGRLTSTAAAVCSASTALDGADFVRNGAVSNYIIRRGFSDVDQSQAPAAEAAGNTKIKSEDQPGDSIEAELTRVRAKKLRRSERLQYLENEDFEDEIKQNSILVEPDIPIYDLRQVLQQVGMPIGPEAPLFDQLQGMDLDSPEVEALLNSEQEEQPPFPGARRILNWEQRIVFSHGSFAGEHPVNRKAKCTVNLRELQQQTGLSDEALQLIARVCGPRYNPRNGVLTLVSEKHSMREENRRHIMQLLAQLVSEGHQAFPTSSKEQSTDDQLPESQQQAQ